MNIYVETWTNANRWRVLNEAVYSVSDGKLHPVDDNPLLLFNQSASMGLVVEMLLQPNDDLQLSLVKPVDNLTFYNQGDITYFGILYEKEFGDVARQFVLNHRGAWGAPLSQSASSMIPDSVPYRLLFSAYGDTVRVKVFSEGGAVLWSIMQTGVLTGDMAFLVNPGRRNIETSFPAGLDPWIGRTTFAWGVTEEFIDDTMDAGAITVPVSKAPTITAQPVFKEKVYSSWESPAFEGSGAFTYDVRSSLPGGLSLVMQGGRIVIFGTAASGSAGLYPVTVDVTDGLSTTRMTLMLNLQVLSAWNPPVETIPDASMALGDYYYQIAGGPVRKEFHVND